MRSNWHRLDDLRESWLFLVLGFESPENTESAGDSIAEQYLTYWEMGTGNAESLVTTTVLQIGADGVATENALIGQLLAALRPHRYQETLLITPSYANLAMLRCRLVQSSFEEASLRGFNHLALADVLETYFGQELRDYRIDHESLPPPRATEAASEPFVSDGSIERVWNVWSATYRLLPTHELKENPL